MGESNYVLNRTPVSFKPTTFASQPGSSALDGTSMIYRVLTACLIAAVSLPASALELSFRAASPEFQGAALEYEKIWAQEGARIVEALESHSGTSLPEAHIAVVVAEKQSNSGGNHQPMTLRASYPEPVKRGTLVHELGHRYLLQLPQSDSSLSLHKKLNLLLLPVWESLWGAEFVADQVAVESKWSVEYRRAWAWAMALSVEQRQSQWRSISAP
jgi:hypothetical protein